MPVLANVRVINQHIEEMYRFGQGLCRTEKLTGIEGVMAQLYLGVFIRGAIGGRGLGSRIQSG
jgi:hypothetical protein